MSCVLGWVLLSRRLSSGLLLVKLCLVFSVVSVLVVLCWLLVLRNMWFMLIGLCSEV